MNNSEECKIILQTYVYIKNVHISRSSIFYYSKYLCQRRTYYLRAFKLLENLGTIQQIR